MDTHFPAPTADFDHPIDILDGCHGRILRNCALVERLAAHVAEKGADTEARAAAVGVIRYFESAARNHHRDEEDDLFPLLRRHTPSEELNATYDLLFRLHSDHELLEGLWTDMRERLGAVVDGHGASLTPAIAARFRGMYEQHIALEEAELLPLARRVLSAPQVAALGGSMARRRGVRHAG